MVQDGLVEGAPQSGLEVAVDVGERQHLVVGGAVWTHILNQRDVVLGERSGLVRAQDIHAPVVLDGLEPFYDHPFLAHVHRPLGQIDGEDHGQEFRRQADREGDREQEGIEDAAVVQHVDDENEDHQGNGHSHYEVTEAGGRTLELRRGAPGHEVLHNIGISGVPSRPHGHAGRGPVDHRCAHEKVIGPLRVVARLFWRERPGALLCGHGLTSKGGLIDEQVLAADNPQPCWDYVSRTQVDDVPRGDLGDGELDPGTVPGQGRVGRDAAGKLLRCVLRPILLDEA